MLEHSTGLGHSMRGAVDLLQQSADQGHAQAQFCLGDLYAAGNGVAQDYGKAVVFLQQSADNGYAEAQCALGRLYASGSDSGNVVPQDSAKAAKLLQQAANKGSKQAIVSLKKMQAEAIWRADAIAEELIREEEAGEGSTRRRTRRKPRIATNQHRCIHLAMQPALLTLLSVAGRGRRAVRPKAKHQHLRGHTKQSR